MIQLEDQQPPDPLARPFYASMDPHRTAEGSTSVRYVKALVHTVAVLYFRRPRINLLMVQPYHFRRCHPYSGGATVPYNQPKTKRKTLEINQKNRKSLLKSIKNVGNQKHHLEYVVAPPLSLPSPSLAQTSVASERKRKRPKRKCELRISEKPQSYKSCLNEYDQKLWKQPPVYETGNEGSGHAPKFRSTVWADGVSYTSPGTFKQRKTNASRIAVFATMHKLMSRSRSSSIRWTL